MITIELINDIGEVIANAQTETSGDIVTQDVIEVISAWELTPGDTIRIINEN